MTGHGTTKRAWGMKPAVMVAVVLAVVAAPALAVNTVTNGTFDSDLSGWTLGTVSNGTIIQDTTYFGNAPGAMRFHGNPGRGLVFTGEVSTTLSGTINSTDEVYLSFAWTKASFTMSPNNHVASVYAVVPGVGDVLLWQDSQTALAGGTIQDTVNNLDVSTYFSQTGTYQLKVVVTSTNSNNRNMYAQFYIDDIVVDAAAPVTNNAPVVAAGATAVSVSPVNRFDTNTTTLSASFSDSDAPPVGDFLVWFRVREPDNSTELVLVSAQTHGNGGLTVTDQGGGNYTASYTWDPGAAQTLGLYDLEFEVSDGTDADLDDFTNNLDELEVEEVLPNVPPSVTPGATTASVSPVNRYDASTTTISTSFSDTDAAGVGDFTVSFRVREPDNSTVVTLVDAQTNGNGGLTITDQGGGNYTASYTWDPGAAQTLGLYDLQFEVSDGTDNDTDPYTSNLDELEVNEVIPNDPPTIVAGATAVSVSPVNRLGNATTVISTDFTDTDAAGVGDFSVTFRIREPDDVGIVTLVNNQTNGNGGLVITDNGGGSYTASYTYDPLDTATTGLYDLYFWVSDGTDSVIDAYPSNTDELEINEVVANNPPSVVAGATTVSTSPVNRYDTNTTTISTQFSDADSPGVGAFTVSFKVREPDNSTEVVLVNALTNGNGGLSITDQGGGNYIASYTWDPGAAQTLGLYDLQFEVGDGSDNDTDPYTSNLDELEVNEVLPNVPPSLTPGATIVTTTPVNRVGSNTTTLSTNFSDTDAAGVGDFIVSFKVREPDNSTEVVLVNALTHGNGGLSITDQGGGDYTATYTWDPGAAQTLGLYDLQFEVSDGIQGTTDPYASNLDELQVNEVLANNAPTVVAGATTVSASPVNRYAANTTTISTVFSDSDQPGVNAFTISFRVREPDNSTELTLVNALTNGNGGLVVTDQGGGNYTASYSWDPGAAQTLGLYDLQFEVSDGTDNASDLYASNLDELEVNEVIPNSPPTVIAGATQVSQSPVNRLGAGTTRISTVFTDTDQPGVNAFTVSFKVREPNNSTELTLVNALTNGNGGLVVTDQGGGNYQAYYDWDPGDLQTIGLYDLQFEVDDGTDNASDTYTSNLDELEINETIPNNVPAIIAGATTASPATITRYDVATTTLSVDFVDADDPGAAAFSVSFHVQPPLGNPVVTVADALQNGVGGMTITDNGGGSYTASIDWDPAAGAIVGYYDLSSTVSDGTDATTDDYAANADELMVDSSGEPSGPAILADATAADPPAIERVGANSSTISALFTDSAAPGVGAYTVSFSVRHPDNSTETALATNSGHGQNGVTITDQGGGAYLAAISWDPPDGQTVGFYDLRFSVSDGSNSVADDYVNNLDELQVYDAVSNNPPTVVAGVTVALPNTVNRNGTGFTMLQSTFDDADFPGAGNVRVTFKVMDPVGGETTVVNNAYHGEQGLRVTNVGGTTYEASVLWDPPASAPAGGYDLYFSVTDPGLATATDDYANNLDELTVSSAALVGDGYLLHRSRTADGCGGPNSACHQIAEHQNQDCLVCHTAHGTRNIYLVNETVQTPNSGTKSVTFKTLGIGDPWNDPDPTVGDPTAGAMADDSDGVHNGICEVCHTITKYHRNDGSHPDTGHHNAEDCLPCHNHEGGFAGGESGGAELCTKCHGAIVAGMAEGQGGFHHNVIDAIDYSSTNRTCLACHVDHDIFRPDTNPGFGTRGANLRSDATVTPVLGDATVLANSDYLPTGNGGVCISCHQGNDCLICHSFDAGNKAAFNHNFVDKAQYDAATTGHNYAVPSTFSSDGSVFNANCTKCHNDNMGKLYQNSTDKFGLHVSDYQEILDPLGIASPATPLEEEFCFQCHSLTNNPNSGSSLDYFGVQPMSNAGPMEVYDDFAKASTHPVTSFSGIHDPAESPETMTRHVECTDCHNVHAATADRPASPALSGALYGVEGVTYDGDRIEGSTSSYQVCFKCHGDQNGGTAPVARVWANTNTRDEFKPTSESFHPVTAAGTNPNSPSLISPWTESSVMTCEDCHASDASGANGPHGSTYAPILKMRYDRVHPNPENATDYELCYSCHDRTSILGDISFKEHTKHILGEDTACFVCHDAHGVASAGVGDGTHLINFATDYMTTSGSGRLEFIDDGNGTGRCYLTCHGADHDPYTY